MSYYEELKKSNECLRNKLNEKYEKISKILIQLTKDNELKWRYDENSKIFENCFKWECDLDNDEGSIKIKKNIDSEYYIISLVFENKNNLFEVNEVIQFTVGETNEDIKNLINVINEIIEKDHLLKRLSSVEFCYGLDEFLKKYKDRIEN